MAPQPPKPCRRDMKILKREECSTQISQGECVKRVRSSRHLPSRFLFSSPLTRAAAADQRLMTAHMHALHE
jgi:hypothetical protein